MKASQIKRLLPSVLQSGAERGTPLAAVLEVMEGMQLPSEAVLDQLDMFFDPHRAPDTFVPYIATWVDLEGVLDRPQTRKGARAPFLPTGIGRLRELVAAAVTLSKWRGTRKGLRLFLETATGLTGFEIDEAANGPDGTAIPFHLRITAPAGAAKFRSLVQRIIELEKPAYVTYDLGFATSVEPQKTTT